MRIRFSWLTPLTFFSLILSFSVLAETTGAEDQVAAKVRSAIPQLPILKVSSSSLKGFYEVELVNGERLFVTADAEHFIAGDLFKLNEKSFVNLSEAKRNQSRADKVAAIKDADKIIFSPKNKKATVVVFTDVDCGYCRRLHQQMAGYLEHGIEIQYLAFPRAGVGSDSYNKVVSAWCAKDKNEAMTRLKSGQEIAKATCNNPVAEQFRLGNEIGVTGTPALVLESGKLYPGYVEPDQLARMLGI